MTVGFKEKLKYSKLAMGRSVHTLQKFCVCISEDQPLPESKFWKLTRAKDCVELEFDSYGDWTDLDDDIVTDVPYTSRAAISDLCMILNIAEEILYGNMIIDDDYHGTVVFRATKEGERSVLIINELIGDRDSKETCIVV